MAKLYFSYAPMNAGKSTLLLQVAHNYEERGMNVYLLTAKKDTRTGKNIISSRIGIKHKSNVYDEKSNLFEKVDNEKDPIACVLVDEAQWLSKDHVDQLTRIVDELHIPVLCYGLRTDFKGNLFPGSQALLALADEIREIRTICHCGKKATMVLRLDADGKALHKGPQNQVGGNESYTSVCRKHWKEGLAA